MVLTFNNYGCPPHTIAEYMYTVFKSVTSSWTPSSARSKAAVCVSWVVVGIKPLVLLAFNASHIIVLPLLSATKVVPLSKKKKKKKKRGRKANMNAELVRKARSSNGVSLEEPSRTNYASVVF